MSTSRENNAQSQDAKESMQISNGEIPQAIVWWDYDSCPLPSRVEPHKAIGILMNHIDEVFPRSKKSIHAFTNVKNINDKTIGILQENNVYISPIMTRRHAPGRSEKVDKVIIAHMAPSLRKPMDKCIVITGDEGFTEHMVALVQNLNDVMLIHPRQAPEAFAKHSLWRDRSYDWDNLLETPQKTQSAVEPSNAVCVHYTRNVCQFSADDCKFLHICSICTSKEHGAVRCPENKIPPPVCAHFEKGSCRWGKVCNLSHKCLDCGEVGEKRCLKCTKKSEKPAPGANFPRCTDNFFCPLGLECQLKHLPPELDCFRNNGGKGVKKECVDICKRGESCSNRAACTYAHNKSEYVCFYCATKGDHLGRNCPKRVKDKVLLAQQPQALDTTKIPDQTKENEKSGSAPNLSGKSNPKKNRSKTLELSEYSVQPHRQQEKQKGKHPIEELKTTAHAAIQDITPPSSLKDEKLDLTLSTPASMQKLLSQVMEQNENLKQQVVSLNQQNDELKQKVDFVIQQNADLQKQQTLLLNKFDLIFLMLQSGSIFKPASAVSPVLSVNQVNARPNYTTPIAGPRASAPQAIPSVNASASARPQNTGMFSFVNEIPFVPNGESSQSGQMSAASGQGRR